MRRRMILLVSSLAIFLAISACDPVSNTSKTACVSSPKAPSDKLIYFLDENSLTIRSIWPDGSPCRTVFKVGDANHLISTMSVSGDGKYVAYALKDTQGYFLLSNGSSALLPNITSLPLWHSHSFIALTGSGNGQDRWGVFNEDASKAPLTLNLDTKGRILSWYPNSNSILYQDVDSNFYRVDVDTASAQYTPTLLLMLNPHGQGNNDAEHWRVGAVAITADDKIVFTGEQVKNLPRVQALAKFHLWMLNAGASGSNSVTSVADFKAMSIPNFVLLSANTIAIDYVSSFEPYGYAQRVDVLALDYKGGERQLGYILTGPSSVNGYVPDYSSVGEIRFIYSYTHRDIAPADGFMNVYDTVNVWSFDGHTITTNQIPAGSYYNWVEAGGN